MIEWYYLVLGAIIFATTGSIIEKKTLYKEHAMEFSTVFYIFITLIAFILLPFTNFNFPVYYLLIIYILSWIDAIGFLFIAKGTRHMQLSSASPLMAFSPVMLAILALIFLKETLSLTQLSGIALVLFGSYILELKPKKSFKEELLTPFKRIFNSKYVHYMLLAMFLYAISGTVARFLLNTQNESAINPFSFILILYIFITMNFTILITIFHDGFKGIKHGIRSAGKWISLMAVVMFIGRILVIIAITLPAGKIAPVVALKRSSLVLTTLIGGGIFKDKRIKQKTLASLIMVAGAIILVL